MAEIVEGHVAPQGSPGSAAPPPGAVGPGAGATPWIDGLRSDLRKEMIRELAVRRIKSGGRENQPSEPGRAGRMIEAFLVGVAVTLVCSWLCQPRDDRRG